MGISLFTYLIESTICIGAFYLLYKLLLSRLTHFEWNRFYLVTAVLLSIVIPLIHIPISFTGIQDESIFYEVISASSNLENELLAPIKSTAEAELIIATITHRPVNHFTFSNFLLIVYFTGLLYCGFRFLQNLRMIFKLVRDNSRTRKKDYYLVNNGKDLPTFSFFKYVFLEAGNVNLNENERKKMLHHELVHIRQYHSLDILFFEIFGVIFWFNPIVKYLKESLREVHEFIADFQTITNDNYINYSKLIVKLSANYREIPLSSSFSYLQIKKRLIMIAKLKSGNAHKIKFALVLPLIAVMLTAFSFSKVMDGAYSEKHTVYNSDGSVKNYMIDEYNKLEDLIKRTWYHRDGDILYYEDYKYEAGKLIKSGTYHGDSVTSGNYAGVPTGIYTLYEYKDTPCKMEGSYTGWNSCK